MELIRRKNIIKIILVCKGSMQFIVRLFKRAGTSLMENTRSQAAFCGLPRSYLPSHPSPSLLFTHAHILMMWLNKEAVQHK
jgi:hypothetical protein